jgi:hypothetical protein
LAAVKVSSDFVVTNCLVVATMLTTPRPPDDDADAATHCDATRSCRSAGEAPDRAAAFNPWKAGNATEVALAEELDDLCSDSVVKLAVTADIDAAAAIGKPGSKRGCKNAIALWRLVPRSSTSDCKEEKPRSRSEPRGFAFAASLWIG